MFPWWINFLNSQTRRLRQHHHFKGSRLRQSSGLLLFVGKKVKMTLNSGRFRSCHRTARALLFIPIWKVIQSIAASGYPIWLFFGRHPSAPAEARLVVCKRTKLVVVWTKRKQIIKTYLLTFCQLSLSVENYNSELFFFRTTFRAARK